WVGFGDPADFYKLTMNKAGTLTLNLSGLSGNANLSLLDSKGKTLKTSMNKGNISESIANFLLTGGTYYVNVAPASGVNSATYTLSHTENYFPTDLANNSWQSAKNIATLDNWVGYGDPADCYKLTMTAAGTLTLNLTGLTADANLSLLDSSGKTLKTSANKGTLSESIANYLLAAGAYYVNVAPSDSGRGGVNTNYTLTHSETYFPADKANNTWQTATAIATLDNWVGYGDPADCYKLVMTGAGTLTLNLTGLNGDANLSLLDSKGKALKTSANKLNASESLTINLLTGTYYVNVAPVKGVNSASYTLTHAENYCPADKANNTWQTANAIATLDNWAGFGDTADCYKLTMTSNGILSLSLTGLNGDANLSLLDSKGKALKTSANKANAAEAITADLLAGTYYVNVAPATGVNSATYTLTHAENYFPDDKAGNTFALSKQVTTSGQVGEWLGFGDNDDYYKFELKTGTTATFNLNGMSSGSNIDLYLYDSKFKQIAISRNAGNAAESITKALAAGTAYYVKAALAAKSANTSYALNFNIEQTAFKSNSLQLFSSASPLAGSSDSEISADLLKKNQGMLAS
ncbi:MAG: PPC domain-containing protein, partial [Victivallaceae bacterium]